MMTSIMHNDEVYDMYHNIEQSCNTILNETFSWGLFDFKRKVRFKVFPDLTFNARSYRGVFINTIGVNIGVLPLIHALAVNYAKLDYVCDFNDGKQYKREIVNGNIKKILATCYVNISRHSLDDDTISSFFDSDDMGDRYAVAYSVFEKMLYFFMLHEYAHLLCGHDRKSVEFGSHTSKSSERNTREYRQWQEIEADMWGAVMLCETLHLDMKPVDDSSFMDKIYKEIGLIYTSIGLLLMSFSFANPLAETIESYSVSLHPHPAIRIANAYETIHRYLELTSGLEVNILKDIMTQSLANLLTLAGDLDMPIYWILTGETENIYLELKRLRDNVSDKHVAETYKGMSSVIEKLHNNMSLF